MIDFGVYSGGPEEDIQMFLCYVSGFILNCPGQVLKIIFITIYTIITMIYDHNAICK